MLYVYAITEGAPVVEGLAGIHGAPTAAVSVGRLAAIASELADGEAELGEDEMWDHERVVETLMADGPVLPLRFGTAVADEAELRGAIEKHAERWATALDRVRGAVELGVRAAIRVEAAEPALAAPGVESGAEYMRRRLEAERAGDAAARRIHEPLAELARESVLRVERSPAPRVRAAYLVDEERVPEFGERVEALRREAITHSVSCTGPWPPYSFTGSEPPR